MNVYFEAFGCTLNKGESYRMAEKASTEGHSIAETAEESDCIVCSTCAVIEATERRMLKRISELAELGKPLIVTGCMAEVRGKKITALAPSSHLLATNEIESIAEVLGKLGVRSHGPKPLLEPPRRNVDVAIPIAQGCLGSCTYCITRLARGRLRSRPPEDIVADAKRALARGFREIRLCAQDTASYGMDGGSSLADLLDSVSSLPGDFRIRVGMMNPESLEKIGDDLIESYCDHKVYKFLHLPVQSGSNDILKSMGRSYSVEAFEGLVRQFKQEHPSLTLSTDIIVGFPGETAEDFQESFDLMKRIEPDMMNITRFSPRRGTPSFEMDGRVAGCLAKRRSRELTRLRSELGMKRNRQLVGSACDVLLTERVKTGSTVGRTMSYKLVVFRSELPLGAFLRARIVDAGDAYVWGEVV
ncbi:MAG: tRNA (N(6)-L-threonylcarbamoyladenosine(37)-C(2))-methylthiotransferase [Thermoplasmata archaeon]